MTVTVNNKKELGIKSGDRLEFKVSGGIINLIPELPSADDFALAQRKVIDAQLAGARKGPYHGPFESTDEAIKFLKKEIRTRVKRKTS
jgi:bifunctional DNA-binding transcriptional regulator/antitoxin component of YhaV-PrlF toxin-antitoxin module